MLIALLAPLKSTLLLNQLGRLSGSSMFALSSINSFQNQSFFKLMLPLPKLSSTALRGALSYAILILPKNGASFFVNRSCSGPLMCLGHLTTPTSAPRFKGLNLSIFLVIACSSSSTLLPTLTQVGLHGRIEQSTSYTTLGAFHFQPTMALCIVYTLPKIECYTSQRVVYILHNIGCYAAFFFWPTLLWPVFYHTFFPSTVVLSLSAKSFVFCLGG